MRESLLVVIQAYAIDQFTSTTMAGLKPDLAESATVSGQKCKEFGPIDFYPDRKFKSCVKSD